MYNGIRRNDYIVVLIILLAFLLVIEFAKKTGDYATLSMPDIRVIALAHTIEKRLNGDKNIRAEPIKVNNNNNINH